MHEPPETRQQWLFYEKSVSRHLRALIGDASLITSVLDLSYWSLHFQ